MSELLQSRAGQELLHLLSPGEPRLGHSPWVLPTAWEEKSTGTGLKHNSGVILGGKQAGVGKRSVWVPPEQGGGQELLGFTGGQGNPHLKAKFVTCRRAGGL